MTRLARWVCSRKGHQWFPNVRSEFLPTADTCLRCHERRAHLPTAQCLGGHPLAEHYDATGQPVRHATCPVPR